ncbi:ABC transporter ATP-binding protein [soil metagenome]
MNRRDSAPDGLEAYLRAAQGDFALDVDLQADRGQVVAVLGPNAAGKSTVLRVLAGLQPLTGGRVRLAGRTLEDPHTGVRLPAQQRRTGLVPQDSLLFPHLSVLDQVAFGPRHGGSSRARARASAAGWLRRTGLDPLADRRPAQLSGGQARRVAITRALAAQPQLLLLDEPLAALDVGAVLELRTFLHRHLRDHDGVTVLVTHDAVDALVLADRLVVLDHGREVQSGAPAAVARRPRSAHVAALVGLNLVRGTASGTVVRVDGGDPSVRVVTATPHDGAAFCAFTPAAVSLHPQRPVASPRNVWSGTVSALTPHGDAVRVALRGNLPLLADVTPAAVADLGLAPGVEVWASVKATEVQVYAA